MSRGRGEGEIRSPSLPQFDNFAVSICSLQIHTSSAFSSKMMPSRKDGFPGKSWLGRPIAVATDILCRDFFKPFFTSHSIAHIVSDFGTM